MQKKSTQKDYNEFFSFAVHANSNFEPEVGGDI